MTLDERYLIERELGRGGIGVVYLAHDQELMGKPVVIKVLLKQSALAADYEWVKKKFHQEIEALARIDHPGVVGVLHAGEMSDGTPYLVMQYIEGHNLRSILRPEGINLERAAHLIRQIGQALDSAHQRGIYHRDLKPENIMLQTYSEGEEYVKLIDFGVATVKDSLVATNKEITAVAGTVSYMAPEQLLGKPSAGSDVYACGVIAYELVSGRRPFNPESPYQLLDMQREGVRIKPADLRPGLPQAAQKLILQALSFEQTERPQNAKDFGEELARALMNDVESLRSTTSSASLSMQTLIEVATNRTLTATVVSDRLPLKVLLLSTNGPEPDEHVSKLIQAELHQHGHEVFVDQQLTNDADAAEQIEQRVRAVDVIIPLLSASSATSEIMAQRIQIANEAAQQQRGKPRLLPVRIDYEDALPEPVQNILASCQDVRWSGPHDDETLASKIIESLKTSGQLPVNTAQIEPPGGAVPLDSRFYLVRPTDDQFLAAIKRRDSIVLVKGARQMGKTSLLARGLQLARQEGARVIITDFQKLNSSNLETIEPLFMALGELIADQLNLSVYPDEVWKPRRAPSINFERYIRREVLEKISAPLVWGLDEVDRLFTCPYASEVFGLFRTWHNERAIDPAAPWGRLTMAIAYATEAHLFITDQNQSPFNVGTRLELRDFGLEQVAELNRRHESPLKDPSEVERFFRLVGGHPYLVRVGLHEMILNNMALGTFEEIADSDEGPFGDHLRRILVLLTRDSVLSDAVREILRDQPCPDIESFYRLRSAGVMAGDSTQDVRPRCQLYAIYLKRHLL